ncbi:MAG TPA: hypothetical protein VFG23_13290 [Polyangia bacterium]|nr:hypothetical protein [Polyangia bacterium]
MAVPTIERPPKGCDATWTAVWRALVAEMKSVGTWKPALWPFAVQYLHALRLAEEHRVLAEADAVDFDRESGLAHMHPGFASGLAQAKQAQTLADLLGITPKAQKALMANVPAAPMKEHPIVARLDQLAQVRQRRAAHR